MPDERPDMQSEVAHGAQVASVVAEQLPEVRFAYVFGSAAAGRLGPESDYDVAVDAGRRLETEEVFELSGRLEGVVGRPVDVVDLSRAGPILKMQVLRYGKLILCRDRRAHIDFQMYTPSQYEDWKILRRPIDEALLRRIQS